MSFSTFRYILLVLMVCIGTGCANIVPPGGGAKDVKAPVLVSVSPADSQLNTKPKRIDLHFNEYITLSDVSTQVQISPILPIQPIVTSVNKKVSIKLADSLLQPNTTYRISFGTAIKDLHEGNVYSGYTYTFSTGNYFDSLELDGRVLSAVTGLPDSGTVLVLLYDHTETDSVVARKKPLYITTAQKDGNFSFKGLPGKSFKIFALKDYNANMMYDGGDEWIGFADNIVKAGDTLQSNIELRVFQQVRDTTEKADTTNKSVAKPSLKGFSTKPSTKAKEGFTYEVPGIDTANQRSRSKEITKSIEVNFNKHIATITHDRITLSYDSADVNVPASFTVGQDTLKNSLLIRTKWQENTLYTLKLLKGFAKDTGGNDAMPSKYSFRTKRDEDYGKLNIHISPAYLSSQNLLFVKNERDTIYQKPITDTLVHLTLLQPETYTIQIIVDKNGNGKWDPGILFLKLQPELVIPYGNTIPLKAGWENTIDFIPVDNTSKSKWGKNKNKDSK